MKYLLLAIAVPDCFSMDGETMEINIKGMPQGEYKTAQVFKKESNELNRRLQAATDKALENLLLYGDPEGKGKEGGLCDL